MGKKVCGLAKERAERAGAVAQQACLLALLVLTKVYTQRADLPISLYDGLFFQTFIDEYRIEQMTLSYITNQCNLALTKTRSAEVICYMKLLFLVSTLLHVSVYAIH